MTAAVVAAFSGLVSLLYATSVYADAADSDKATTILVGQALGNGQLLLHGWILPPGNYWTIDAAFYGLAVHLGGLRPSLLYAEPAVVAAVVISIGVLLAVEGHRGSAAVAGAVAVVTLLAFSPPAMAFWFVGKGFHIGTGLYALISFGALRRGRFGWGWAVAVILLAFGMLGDFMIVAFGLIPLFVAGLISMLRRRSWHSGIAQVTAAVASFGIGELALGLVRSSSSFQPGQQLPVASTNQMLTNLVHVFTYSAHLVGLTNSRFDTAGVPPWLLGLHGVGAICIAACVLAALKRLVVGTVRGHAGGVGRAGNGESWRLDDMLLAAAITSVAPFVILAGANGVGTHFLVVTVVFASILTGRVVAAAWHGLVNPRAARHLAIAGTAVSLSFAAGLGYKLSLPEPVQPAATLATWLEAHDLRSGIGGYWVAALTTVESKGGVTIRPVTVGTRDGMVRSTVQSSATWYADKRFQFYVYDVKSPDTDVACVRRAFGMPDHVYAVGPYRVLVWGHALKIPTYPSVEASAEHNPGPHGVA